ncbi:MAG: peptidase [Planctomycetes bacterium]|nr:peptidase [Planctomycetota bacterium]
MFHRSLAALCVACLSGLAPAQVQSPEAFLGHAIGADGKLADYSDLVRYWRALDEASPRLTLESMGDTSYGQTQWLAVISSPENLARVEALRQMVQRLALGEIVEDGEAQALAAQARAIVWIDGGLHASESIAGQNILELVWQMVSRDDQEVRRILDQVVLLVCPANPDGMELVANGYRATGRVGLLPVLYQRYIGHDNNRDHYMGNQPETRNIQRALYHRWLPQIVYNHHQTAPRGTVIFTPPFRDPFNYEFDPLIVRGIDLISAQMNRRFAAERKAGVISKSGALYSTWWNGGLRTTAYFHNMIGILTEVFGSPDPTPLRPSIDRRLPSVDYPDPIGTTVWRARQTIEYLQTANFAILDHASRYREELLLDQWRMARHAIEMGSRDHWTPTPRLIAREKERQPAAPSPAPAAGGAEGDLAPPEPTAVGADEAVEDTLFTDKALRDARSYVIPADQPDFTSAVRLVRVLRRGAVKVDRLGAAATLPDGLRVPAGSFVVDAAQPFRAHLRDLLEPQWHPDDIGSSGEPIRPYDSAGWTLAMQMDVRVIRLFEPCELPRERVDAIEVPFPSTPLPTTANGWLLDARDVSLWPILNDLLGARLDVRRFEKRFEALGRAWPAGTVYVPASETSARVLTAALAAHGGNAAAIERLPAVAMVPLRAPRIGLFDPFGGEMATGWTEWTLREFGFTPARVFGARIEDGGLRADFDVLVFCTGLPAANARGRRDAALERGGRITTAEQLEALRTALPPFEDWSTLTARNTRITREKGVSALAEFVDQGGTLIALGAAVEPAVGLFELPVEVGLKVEGEKGPRPANNNEFFVPGSLLWLDVDVDDPLAFGLSSRQAAMFRSSAVLTPREGARVGAVWSRDKPLLASGWVRGGAMLLGKAAVAEIPRGKGRFVLFSADVVYRGQPTGTMKMLFDACFLSGR